MTASSSALVCLDFSSARSRSYCVLALASLSSTDFMLAKKSCSVFAIATLIFSAWLFCASLSLDSYSAIEALWPALSCSTSFACALSMSAIFEVHCLVISASLAASVESKESDAVFFNASISDSKDCVFTSMAASLVINASINALTLADSLDARAYNA